jgi:hypothetical protein
VYDQLRLAAGLLRRERPGHALQPTALVHEALELLASLHERQGQVVELRFFGGYTMEEEKRKVSGQPLVSRTRGKEATSRRRSPPRGLRDEDRAITAGAQAERRCGPGLADAHGPLVDRARSARPACRGHQAHPAPSGG